MIARPGPDQRISAVISMPDKGSGGVCVIFLNAGIIHRIGPGRLYVKMARALATRGIITMRLDLSGLGESAQASSGRTHIAQAQIDIEMAIAHMRARVDNVKIYLCGICSGADLAFNFCQDHDGVSGVILLDPYAYKSSPGYRRYLWRRALETERWPGYLNRVLSRSRYKPEKVDNVARSVAEEIRPLPSRNAFGQGLQQLSERDIKVHIFYTRAVHYLLSTTDDFFDTFKDFDLRSRLKIEVDPSVDHTFMTLKAQKIIIRKLLEWLDKA